MAQNRSEFIFAGQTNFEPTAAMDRLGIYWCVSRHAPLIVSENVF
jgi:hypothetical protein